MESVSVAGVGMGLECEWGGMGMGLIVSEGGMGMGLYCE